MKQRTARGFTLIELLIVIAVLGILAVAVLSAINPIEQINRSRDTGSRSDAEQLLGAVDRYYASIGHYPWVTEATTSQPTGWVEVGDGWNDGTDAVLSKLSAVGTGEIKASFTDRITGADYNKLFVYNSGLQGESTYVCFEPLSSSFKTEAKERCTSGTPDDFPDEACDAANEVYYSCLP